jgi:hypothetical protein
MESAPHRIWQRDVLANAVDRVFAQIENPTIADMIAAVKHCEDEIPPTTEPFALDECLKEWAQKRGLRFK